jgi:trigger factor
MEINVESLSTVKKKITFVVPADRVSVEIDKVYAEIAKRASIKGFRKGKVPKSIIEKQYSDMMEQDVVKNLVNDTYFKALSDENIVPVSYPEIDNDDLVKGEPFRYSAIVEIFPEVSVKEFDGLELRKEQYLLKEEVIDQRLEEMRESMSQLKPVEEERPSAMGDIVTFDFEGSIDGILFEGGKAEDFQLELGSGRFIPGFEEQLCGISAGEERQITVTFPENYGKTELAGKEAVFAVLLKDVRTKELPLLDDEFAKGVGEFETLDELRMHLSAEFEKQEKERINGEFRDRLVQELIAKNDLEVPEALIGQQVELMLDNAKKRLAYQQMSLEMMGLDENSYKLQFRSVAESQVKGSLLLEELARQENFTVTDSDLEDKFRSMAGDNDQSLDAVKKYYLQNAKAKGNLMAQIREDKAIDFLINRAKITEVPHDMLQK